MIHSNDQDLSNFTMLDLFRSEVESHAATLNEGLLSLENDPEATDNIEALMRAAHSIKGGARIVELDAAVKLAHTMEDCFVAMQKGELSLDPDHIDILLRGVDMLIRISEAGGDDSDEWTKANQKGIDDLVAAISSILSGEPLSLPKMAAPKPVQDTSEKKEPAPSVKEGEPPATAQPPGPDALQTDSDDTIADPVEPHTPVKSESAPRQPAAPRTAMPPDETFPGKPDPGIEPPETKEPVYTKPAEGPRPIRQKLSEKDRMVRVTAGKIERLMGLAGEVVISSRWLSPFYDSLMHLKKKHAELLRIQENLQELLDHKFEDKKSGNELTIRKHISKAREKAKECNQELMTRLRKLDMFNSSAAMLSDRLYHEVIGVRMRPFSDGIRGFPRMIRDMARRLEKKVQLKIIGENTDVDRDILEKLDAPLIHLLRNGIDHGIESPEKRVASGKSETGTITLEAMHRSGMLMIRVSDDGKGIEPEHLRRRILDKGLTNAEMVDKLTEPELMEFLFLPGFSTLDSVTEISGRGVGLDVVHNMVHEVRGIVRAVSKPGHGLTFHLELPLTLSVVRTFVVEITNETYAFPLARIDRCLMLSTDEIETVEDRQYFRMNDRNISIVDIHDVLELKKVKSVADRMRVVVISDRMHSYGLVVDKFIGECDLVVRPLDSRLGKLSDITSMAIMLDGSPVLIFDVEDLVRSIDGLLSGQNRIRKIGRNAGSDEDAGKRILVVDDSITVREMERKILESKGYNVDVAVDGMEAWNLVRTVPYEMVVSDIDMPRMNGIELISHIKELDRLKSMPVMVVSYKDKEEDRLKGLEAGADYYLTKSSFQDNSFIEAVVDLIGESL